VKGKGKAFL